MIRPFTCVCMLLAAGSGLYLYQTKHRAQLLDREIERTLKATEVARARIGVLKGEWALLSEPERLAELSQQHLGLRTLAPTQFVAMADLAARLPAPLPPGSIVTPMEDAPAEPTPAPPQAAPPAALAGAKPAPAAARTAAAAPPRPVQLAALPEPPVLAAPRPAAKPTVPAPVPLPTPAPRVAPVAQPTAQPTPQPAPQPAPSPTPPRLFAPIVNVTAGPIAAPGRTPAPATVQTLGTPAPTIGESVARTTRLQAPATASTPGTQVAASVLGGARTALPAPVPYTGAR